MKILWKKKVLVLVLTLFSVGILINFMALFVPYTNSKKILDISQDKTILVVAAHQDDELIIAGGAIIKTLNKAGKIYIIYTADGITRKPNLTEEEIEQHIINRETESYNLLNSLGIPSQNILFLRNENEKGLQNISNIQNTIQNISTYIKKINPDRIFISAYEGGHCDHDMTNYMVVKAAEKANFSKSLILESPEYNRYYLSESMLRRMNKLLIIKYPVPPRFIPNNSKAFTLDMTPDELKKKFQMFTYFKSQNPDELIERFGYPDQYRFLINYNYSAAPFDPNSRIRYRTCLLIRGSADKCSPFYCGMTFKDYKDLYQRLEDKNK